MSERRTYHNYHRDSSSLTARCSFTIVMLKSNHDQVLSLKKNLDRGKFLTRMTNMDYYIRMLRKDVFRV